MRMEQPFETTYRRSFPNFNKKSDTHLQLSNFIQYNVLKSKVAPLGRSPMSKIDKSPLKKEKKFTFFTPQQQLAQLIRKHRTAYKMSQAELARLAGATQPAIAKLEAGRANPTLKTIITIASVFQLEVQLSLRRPPKA
jgi:DNA-binding XRE family transcriptional regulator